jgi:uncharacterized sulfatase
VTSNRLPKSWTPTPAGWRTRLAAVWLAFFGLVLGPVVPTPAPAAAATTTAAPPNIVLIISDDHAWKDYSFMGHPVIRTPNLDRLAAQSLVFRRGYVPSSLCCPSLASILTGRFPHEHRVTSNDPPLPAGLGLQPGQASKDPTFLRQRAEMQGFIEQTPTLTRLLAGRGYLSFQAGKWWQGHFSRGGFTHGMTLGDASKGGRHGDEGLIIGRKTMQPVLDFIDDASRQAKPFLVWYAPMMPHDPHTPPERLLAKYRSQTNSIHVARYWAMVEWFDETCGQLLDHLDRRQLATNTIVVYVTDNGWIQNAQTNRYAPRSKQSPYDGGLRTPILVRWPGRVAPQDSSHLASSLDLMPTLLAATGQPTPRELPGINLLDPAAVTNRHALFGECFTHNAVDLQRPAASLRWRWTINDSWKLIVPAAWNEPNGQVELFDLAKDPDEQVNLAAREPGRVQALTRTLDRWWLPQP